MTIINFMYAEVYNDSLELFFKRGLRDYVANHNNSLVLNGIEGNVILDIKCKFVERVQKMKGVKVLYFPDNLDRFGKLFEACEQYYDLIFFAHENKKIDNKRYFHLPVAYDPYTHYPFDIRKTIDVAFVGTKHRDRRHIAEIPDIKIYGNEWGDGIYPVYSAEKRKVYAQTRIMVNHHVDGDTSPNMRTFECLAMKTFLLSDLVPEELEGGMVQYNGQSDLETKIAYYLGHDDERTAIAVRGYELVQPYTYEKRMEEMIEVIENARLG